RRPVHPEPLERRLVDSGRGLQVGHIVTAQYGDETTEPEETLEERRHPGARTRRGDGQRYMERTELVEQPERTGAGGDRPLPAHVGEKPGLHLVDAPGRSLGLGLAVALRQQEGSETATTAGDLEQAAVLLLIPPVGKAERGEGSVERHPVPI